MAKPKITFLSADLYDLGYIKKFPVIKESKGFGRGKLSPSTFNFVCRNDDNQFSIDNPLSYLNNINWLYSSIQAIDEEGIITVDGICTNITRDHNDVMSGTQISGQDVIFRNRKTAFDYESSDWETAGEAVKNIMIQENFTNYDTTTLENSISVLKYNNCFIKCNFNKSDNVTFMNALNKLAVYGSADVYMKQNKVNFKTWQAYAGGVSVNFDYSKTEERPVTHPKVSTMEQTFYNEYSIGYSGDNGTPASDTDNLGLPSRDRFGTQSLEISQNNDSTNQIIIKDLVSAKFIGETYINRSHYTLSPIPAVLQVQQFKVNYSYKRYIELNTYFRMTYDREGWKDKVFEIAGIQRDYTGRIITVDAWEVRT